MPKKTTRAQKAGPAMAGQRVANVRRIQIKKYHLELDPKTGRPKR
jgi:hypothetical protein